MFCKSKGLGKELKEPLQQLESRNGTNWKQDSDTLRASYSCCNGPMLLSFVVDHPDASFLEHLLHLLWSCCGGKVHIVRPLPRQQVPHRATSDPQLMLVLPKQLWKQQTHTLGRLYRGYVSGTQTIALAWIKLERHNLRKLKCFCCVYPDCSSHFAY